MREAFEGEEMDPAVIDGKIINLVNCYDHYHIGTRCLCKKCVDYRVNIYEEATIRLFKKELEAKE